MSFWDKVKSFARSAKCTVGWHGGEYTRIDGKPKCHLGKTCPHCNDYLTKEEHEFSEWLFMEEGDCNARRECIYCGYDEHEVKHNYEKVAKDFSNCEILLCCRRCGNEKVGPAEHEWVEQPQMECTPDNGNANKKQCKVCGLIS